jgi:hypothetical protein
MIKGISNFITSHVGHFVWGNIYAFAYPVAIILGMSFLLAWIMGWKKGFQGSMWVLAGYSIIVILDGLL